MREAHQKALATAAALEGEIERLSCPLSQRQPEVGGSNGRNKDCRTHGSTECKKMWHQVQFNDTPTTHLLAKENLGSAGGSQPLRIQIWVSCQSWNQGLPPSSLGWWRAPRKRNPLWNQQSGYYANG